MEALSDKEDSYAAAIAKAAAEKAAQENAPVAPAQAPAPEPAASNFAPETFEVAAVEIEEVEKTQEFPAQSQQASVAEAVYQAPAPAPKPAPAPAPAPAPRKEPVIPSSAPQSHAEGLIIGEVGSDVPVDTSLIEPREFEIPGGDRWGDRDDDLDIEEID